MSALADVRDMDMVASLNPFRLDLGSSFVTGAQAIVRRVLYLWCTYLGTLRHAPGLGILTPIIDLPGTTFSPRDLQGLRSTLETQAAEVEFVDSCRAQVSLAEGGLLNIPATITLTDNKAYRLELSVGAARTVLLNLGSELI